MSSGNIMRDWAKELWLSIYEFEDKIAKEDDNFDLNLDNKVREFWVKNDNFIFESRLARYFIPDSFKIFMKCEDQERYNRIQNREQITMDEVLSKTKKREDELVERYSKIYPNITFPPSEEEFDLVVDVTNITPEEIVEIIMSKILINYMY